MQIFSIRNLLNGIQFALFVPVEIRWHTFAPHTTITHAHRTIAPTEVAHGKRNGLSMVLGINHRRLRKWLSLNSMHNT